MFQKVIEYVKENEMIQAGDEILAGVSGGADSVCLFFLLQKMQEVFSFHLTAMHINHNLRENAKKDQEFVRNLCKTYQVPFVEESVDVLSLVEKEGLSVEEAARIARYHAFQGQVQRMKETTGNTVRLAVAHHENDQAETVLFHLFRGCSLAGLRGMKPVRKEGELILIRPLLCVGRGEIEEFLKEHRLTYVTDETNMDNRYSRNLIRNQLLPMAEKDICKQTIRHIARTAEDMGNIEEFLDTVCQKEYESTVIMVDQDTLKISSREFLQKHDYLKRELLYRAISQLAGAKKDIARVHMEEVLKLFSAQVGRQVDLPYGICAGKTYDGVELFKKKPRLTGKKKVEIPLEIPGKTFLLGHAYISAQVFPYDKTREIPKKKYTKWFDYDKIKKCLVVRNREASDYFYIDGSHKKMVKDFMVNEKIVREKRDELLLLCEENHMVWMPGYRISAYYKVNHETENILELSYVGGTNDGRED